MSGFPELAAEIDSCAYLFVRDLSEPGDNSLRLRIEEASPRPEAESRVIAGVEIKDAHRIESNDQSRLFEITWPYYVAFSVRNESYVPFDRTETISGGQNFQILTKSHFLEYVSRATFANNEYPGPMTHYRICCENQIIDIVATEEPVILRLPSAGRSVPVN
jgi:hypothetical protein